MVATIAQLIGKVNPKLYAENGSELLKKYGSSSLIPAEEIKAKPLASHEFIYDSSSETLEPIYFFILDLMNDNGLSTEKLVDNFASSPGSGHFAELGQRATVMQQQGQKILGDVNTVLRSVLNIVYDLKEFKIRLDSYDALKNPETKDAAILSLKQVWMDKVDINKGNSSIKAMALGQAGFQTLISAFLFVNDPSLKGPNGKEIDLNEVVKRILRGRILEFNSWLKESEKELRKRYELERTYLKSQVNSLKLYARWAKPYLKAAQELEMKDMGRNAAMVKAFNTIVLELTLLGKKELKIGSEVLDGNLPKQVEKMKLRKYYSCTLVDFKFRGIPQRVSQQSHYVFGGRSEVIFNSYALTEEEIKRVLEELDSSDIGDVLRLIEGSTGESMAYLQDEINSFLEDNTEEDSSQKAKDTSNPFIALMGGYESSGSEGKKEPKKEKKPEAKKSKPEPENYVEKEYLRKLAERNSKEITFRLFDIYKKAHGMPSYT